MCGKVVASQSAWPASKEMMSIRAGLWVAIASLLVVCVAGGRADAREVAAARESVQPPARGVSMSPGEAASRCDPEVSLQRGASGTGDVPVVSIERILVLLESGSIFGVERLSPNDLRPVYRSRVEERAFKLPDFVSTLGSGFVAVPPGGLTQYEIDRLITPDMYRGMAVFTNQEVLRVMALALRNALLLRGLSWAVDKGKDAWDAHQVERIRDEIRKEIAAIEEENRRKASEIKTPGPVSGPKPVPGPMPIAVPAPVLTPLPAVPPAA
jgi:hypothetical protein